MANSFDARSALQEPGTRAQDQLSSLLDRVPGYSGYRDKENRRDADRAVRDDLSRGVAAAAERVERVARDLADRRKLRNVSAVDSWIRALRHLRDRIQTASYGYAGIFGEDKVDAAALDQLRAFDEALLSQVQTLEDPVAALEAALVADGDFKDATDRGLAATRELSDRFDTRETVVRSGTAAPGARMSELLESPSEQAAPETWQLDAGDALSVTGDNYLVDARLDVAAGAAAFRLFRLGEPGAGRWLYVPQDAAERPALVRLDADIDATAGNALHSGQAAAELIGPAGKPRSATAAYEIRSVAADADGRVVIVEWPDERMSWSGTTVMPEEITVYGSSARSD